MWLKEARICCPPEMSMILIGNKSDKDDEYNCLLIREINVKNRRVVSYDEGEKFAEENGMMFLETSCKAGDHVKEVRGIDFKGN